MNAPRTGAIREDAGMAIPTQRAAPLQKRLQAAVLPGTAQLGG